MWTMEWIAQLPKIFYTVVCKLWFSIWILFFFLFLENWIHILRERYKYNFEDYCYSLCWCLIFLKFVVSNMLCLLTWLAAYCSPVLNLILYNLLFHFRKVVTYMQQTNFVHWSEMWPSAFCFFPPPCPVSPFEGIYLVI